MDQNLVALQQELYHHLKKRVRDIFGKESPELTQYRRDYQRLAKKHIFTVTQKEFIRKLKQSDLVFLGDFHTFDQNIRNFERIVREGFSGHRLAIGIEFVNSTHQIYVDQYMEGTIDEYTFLEKINYSESWRFPWSHYQKIFNLAKENSYHIIALNSVGRLKQRDRHAADLIAQYYQQHAKGKLIVLFGEYHLVADKLPKKVAAKLPTIRHLTIHQNIDQLYWKLVKKKGDTIFSFNSNEFLLLTSPPWIKFESMIYWYENLSDDPDFDIHQYLLENGTKTFSENAEENFSQLCQQLVQLLGVDCNQDQIEDFNLLDHRKLDYLHHLMKKKLNSPLQRFYRKLIKNGKSFKMVGSNSYYCSNYSINRLSFLAGTHIHTILSKDSIRDAEIVLINGKQSERFFFLLYQSLFSYFCSKLLNPFRKCDLYRDVENRINLSHTPSKKKKNLQLALDIISNPDDLSDLITHTSLRGLHSTAKTIGNMLADWIFDELYKKEERTIQELLPVILGHIFGIRLFGDEIKDIFKQSKFLNGRKRLF